LPTPKGMESAEIITEDFRSDITEDESIQEIARILMSTRPRRGAPEETDVEPEPLDKVGIFGEALAAYSREVLRP